MDDWGDEPQYTREAVCPPLLHMWAETTTIKRIYGHFLLYIYHVCDFCC